MNNKGLTIIELITTFSLASVIIILLINIVIVIKNIYSKSEIRSELVIEQSNISNLINKKFKNDSLVSYEPCSLSDFCYEFLFTDGSNSILSVDHNYIKFDNYVYNLKENTKIGHPTVEIDIVSVSNVDKNNSFLTIKIPITNKLYPKEDFGINLVYQYNSNLVEL